MYQEISIPIRWGRLAAKKWSATDAAEESVSAPLVLLHGWLDNANSFDLLVAHLNYPGEIIAIDLPGHGLSDHRPPGTSYHFWDAAVDVGDALRSLGHPQFILLGHSLGGGITSVVSAFFPELTRAAIFIEALGPFTSEPNELVPNFRQFIESRQDMDKKRKPLYPDVATAVAARMTVGGISRPAVQKLCERGLINVDGGVTWRSDSRLKLPSILRLTEAHVLGYLSEIKCPVLLIRGTEGGLNNETILNGRRAAVKGLKEVAIPGGHHLHMDNPEKVAEPIINFLNHVN